MNTKPTYSRSVCFPALVLSVLIFSVAARAQQLSNPGFEGAYSPVNSSETTITGSVANGWLDGSSWANVAVAYAQESSNCHSGTACQKVAVSAVNTGQVQLYQVVQLNANNRYTAGVWLRGTPGTVVHLSLIMPNTPFQTFAETPAYLTSAWQYVSVPSHMVVSQPVNFMIIATQPTTFWADDASLSSVYDPVTPQISPNPKLTSFGMHINNYLSSKGPNNLDFEGPFQTVSSSESTITGSIGQYWLDNSEWANVVAAYSANTASPHGGAQAQRVTISQINSGNVQFAQLVNLTYGQTYSASAWLRGTAGMNIAFGIRQWGSPYTFYGYQSVTATGNWQQLNVSGQVSASGISVLMILAYTPGTLDTDDVQLLDTTGKTPNLGMPWPSAQFGTWRLWDQAGTTWAALEPQKGVWNFSLLDQALSDATAHGTQLFLTLGQTPTWASARPTEFSYYGAGAAAEPVNDSDWVTYLQTVATRYKGKIFNYEIWNEPNDPQYFSGSLSKMLELSQLAYTTLKQVDPRINVIGPAPYSTGYLQQFLSNGGVDYLDTVAFHIYDYTLQPEDDARVLADLRTITQQLTIVAGLAKRKPHGGGGGGGSVEIVGKPIWITEGANGDTTTTDETAAAGLFARKYLVQFLYGSANFNWYTWGVATQFCLATTEADGLTLSKAGASLQYLEQWLVGSTLKTLTFDNQGSWVVGLQTASGAKGYIVWNPNGARNWAVPGNFKPSQVQDLFGGITSATGLTSISVSPQPVLITGS